MTPLRWLAALSILAATAQIRPLDQPPPSVDSVSRARFRRIEGQTTGGGVLDVRPQGWMSQAVGAPSVVRDRSRYRMWFTGVRRLEDGESPYLFRSAIGAATSRDGIRWTVLNRGEPVLAPGREGTFDALATGQPCILRDRHRYLMWYGGADGRQAPDNVRIERIGLAESADGIHWTRLNGGAPVVDIGPPGSVDATQATSPFVARVKGTYRMWYGAFNGRHTISAAHSIDGIRWQKTPVTGLGPGEALGPAVYIQNGQFFMLYSTVMRKRWMMVAARSDDGLRWTPVADGRPVLDGSAAAAFDATGEGQNHSVHPSELLWDGGHLRAWFVAESGVAPFPQRIGIMEAMLPGRARPDRRVLRSTKWQARPTAEVQ